MKKLPVALASTLALSSFVLLGSSNSSSAPLAQQANAALGLSSSVIGDVRVVSTLDDRLVVGLEIPGAYALFDLAPHSVRAENFEVREQLEDGSWITLPEEPVSTYRGTIVGRSQSSVAASMLADGFHARVLLGDGREYWIEPLARHLGQASGTQHAVYRSEDVLETGATCDADLMAPLYPPNSQGFVTTAGGAGGAKAVVTADLACDADFEYYSDWGSGTAARIQSVINTMNAQYDSDVGITHNITTILVRTSSNDPYTKKVASQLLGEFRAEWNANQGSITRSVAHLFTGRSMAGSTIGVAYVGTVCNLDVAYGLVQSDFSGNFACATDLSAHELGHNWGASHCSCSSYTMNASITCANRFNPSVTVPVITAYRDAQTCFGPPPATGSIAGTVTDSATGNPIAGATVQADSGQSDTTAGNGSYSIADVPTGPRTVTASAPGYDAANQNVNVNENQTATADFALDPAPVGSQAVVDCITYRSTGGPNSDRNLFIDVTIVNDAGDPVSGASVSVSVTLDGGAFGSATGTTDSSGEVTFQAKNSPNGCFVTDVTNVSASGLTFDGSEPANGFAKGSDASPDPDCRSGSDGCGAG